MIPEHSSEHEERLRAVVTGELDASALAGCATCAERLEELGALAKLLENDATAERSVLDEARAERDAVAEARAASFLRERLAPRADAAPPPRSGPLPWIAAAAVLIGLTVWIATRASAPHAPIVLDTASLECLAPKGSVDSFREFSWRGTLPPGGWYEIDVEGEGGSKVSAAHLEESRWSPSDEERSRLPASIRWTVRTVDATGSRVESCAASASRSH